VDSKFTSCVRLALAAFPTNGRREDSSFWQVYVP
jgi:hypothetical protein